MAERLRFHLDEHVDSAVARALRNYGIDVTTTAGVGLLAQSDLRHLELARQEQRVIVTHDSDFLRLASAGEEHAGIAYCHQDTRAVGKIIRSLILMYEILLPDEMAGRVEFL